MSRSRGVRESDLERRLHDGVVAAGGFTYKWVSPGRRGVPDRIVSFGGEITFVEMKAPNGSLKPWQQREQRRLRCLGHAVLTLWTAEQVDEFVGRLA